MNGRKKTNTAYKNHKYRHGFTLIELLVVIAIISLLVSILLPSLQKAKALAMQVVCLTRLKSIGSALSIYQADFDGRGPVGDTLGTTGRWSGIRNDTFTTWNPYWLKDGKAWNNPGWFSKKDREGEEVNRFKDPSGNAGERCWGLGEYVDRKGNYVSQDGGADISPVACPSSKGIIGDDSGKRAGYSVNYYLGFDTFLGDYANTPANNPMLMDGSADGVHNTWMCHTFPKNPPYPWWETSVLTDFPLCAENAHDGSANFLFFDGHAENHVAPHISDITKFLEYYRNLWSWYGD